jgi:RNA polymerase sigma factor (sigma-70 family)
MCMDGNAEVYAKYREELLRYATGLVGASRADDVVSTVVLRAIRRRSLAELDNPRAYLLKGVLNEARGLARGQATVPLAEEGIGDRPIELLDVIAAVWRLPVRQRAAVFLFYWEGYPVVEIAELMGVGPGTVKRYLHVARRRLKGQLR